MKKSLIVALLLALSSTPSFAKETASAIYSPNCTAKQLKEMAGDALVKISKNQAWSNDTKGFIVTLDTDKMSFADLAKKMQKAGCFKTN